jgi:uncharacterized protein (TIRG00374 family)
MAAEPGVLPEEGESVAPPARRRRLRGLILSLAVTAIVIALLLQVAKPAEIAQLLRGARPGYILLALGFYASAYLFRAWRIRQFDFLSAIPLLRLLRIVTAHGFFNQVLPARSGELTFIYFLRRYEEVEVGRGAGVLVLVRVYDYLAMSLCLFGALLLHRLGYSGDSFAGEGLLIGAAGLIFLLVLAAGLGLRPLWGGLMALWNRYVSPARWAQRRVFRTLGRWGGDVQDVLQRAGDVAFLSRILFFSILVWAGLYGTFWALLQSVALGDYSLAEIVIGSTGAALGSVLPINAIGSFGTLEVGWAAGFALVGMPIEDGVATSLLVHVCLLIFSAALMGAGYLIGSGGARRSNGAGRDRQG